MSRSSEMWQAVRRRAQFACEFCGVHENDCGGELTIDHFQPQSLGGDDSLENLLYCCFRCNLFKADYWPKHEGDLPLWHPRGEPANTHWFPLSDGKLFPATPIGRFTIDRLRLNRPALIAYRIRKQAIADEARLLSRLTDLIALLEQLKRQEIVLLEERRVLLEQQRAVLAMLKRRLD